MSSKELGEWLRENQDKSPYWVAKRLSSNDTGLTGGHQGGPLIARTALFKLFPKLAEQASITDDHFPLKLDSHGQECLARAVWYNSKAEGRFTNLGGRKSSLLDIDNTGALAVFAFRFDAQNKVSECRAWLCRNLTEEELFEQSIGPVEPKEFLIWFDDASRSFEPVIHPHNNPCFLHPEKIPHAWMRKFPSGEEIIDKVIELRPKRSSDPDTRLVRRRECEYELFQSIESATFLPRMTDGFRSMTDFTSLAQSILQSRKSRSGKSLELHARQIFVEEGLKRDQEFSHQPKIDGAPDFVFPSQSAYVDPDFPVHQLRMMAAKTTCKDRWRQVTREAKRVKIKHLLTLQQGVTESQFNEMEDAGVRLVVPKSLHTSYPESVRARLLSFENFIKEVQKLSSRR
ncbi:MAG: type II restriction endonuclease [Pseudomonadota bacterium]